MTTFRASKVRQGNLFGGKHTGFAPVAHARGSVDIHRNETFLTLAPITKRRKMVIQEF